MMQGKASFLLRLCLPIIVALSLLLALAPSAFAATQPAIVGPKANYLATGDSLAFGYQPNLDWVHGYANDLDTNFQSHGESDYDNYGCLGETSTTFIQGGCPHPFIKKTVYSGPQLAAVLKDIKAHAGQVSPVTLDIGANDLLPDINSTNCTVSANWNTHLATLDNNLTRIILPQLVAALTVNGQRTGDLLLMGYYDPYQNICPNSVPFVQQLNQHLQADASGFAIFVDVFTPFGGAATPNPNICNYTWICSSYKDIHARAQGYSVVASAFERAVGY
ncbi:MAG TPA: GDSL-type esterase/lipase family protein [Ktedonobacteraceae bacterium]|nr:GDSL-type esterase/lipase family protein [Ktedonobacteraceae bacterium]